MIERIVTNVHKEHGVITTLYGRGWKPLTKGSVLREIDRDEPEPPKYFVKDNLAAREDSGNPIRPVHGYTDYLRTDPNTGRRNLGALPEPGRLEGDLKDEEGQPVKEASIVLCEPNGKDGEYDWLRTETDSRGHFDLGGVPEGTWKLVVKLAGAALAEETLEVRPRRNEVELRPVKPGRLSTIPDLMSRIKGARFKTGTGVTVRLRRIGSAFAPHTISVEIDGLRVGTIGLDGSFRPTFGHRRPGIEAALRDFNVNPKAALRAFGRDTCYCSVCGRLLTNPESVARGIGPICEGRL